MAREMAARKVIGLNLINGINKMFLEFNNIFPMMPNYDDPSISFIMSNFGHGTQEITDPVEEMLKKTGCIELHYKVQECIAMTQDWRKCQDIVGEFKSCMTKYTDRNRKQRTSE